MKNKQTNLLVSIILIIMVILLVPFVAKRINAENDNKNVVVSLLYNDIQSKVSKDKLTESLKEYKALGVDTVSVMEDDLNAFVSRGDVTSIKYNVLRHKYDDESMEIADLIAEKYPNVNYDSHVIIASRDKAKDFLAYSMPRRFTADEYVDIGVYDDLYIYVLHDGRRELWEYSFGYDEEVLEALNNEGLKIALVHKVKNYSAFEYLDDIDRLVKKYDIEFLNLKLDSKVYVDEEMHEENYIGLCDIINNNDMTLVVTENPDQLSNEKFFGYSYIFDKVMSEDGSNKVLRSYETYDDSQMNETFYKHRVEQYFNSTIDRNIRFITVTQLNSQKLFYHKTADFTFKAVSEYIDKITDAGFTVNADVQKIDYHSGSTITFALCAVIMVLSALIIIKMLFGETSKLIDLIFIIIAMISFLLTFFMPHTLMSLYPTLFCLVQSCVAITFVFAFIRKKREAFSLANLIISSLLITLATLLIGAMGMGAMLSGIDYYFNNLIFRGIKISLIVPIFYSALAYYFMFIKTKDKSIITDVKNVLNSNIKLYAVIIGLVVAGVGLYYIIRSGNVNTISSLERAMRNAITDIFPARPRTKEFLIGYPALILFVYYSKKSNSHLIKWLLAVASSILFASVTNSFCHVFTDFATIVGRVINALIIAIPLSAVVYLLNLLLVFIIKKINGSTEDLENTNG